MTVRTIIIAIVILVLGVVAIAQYEGTAYGQSSSNQKQYNIELIVTPGCDWCAQSEQYLTKHHFKYITTKDTTLGVVPRLWVDGSFQGIGYDAVKTWVDAHV